MLLERTAVVVVVAKTRICLDHSVCADDCKSPRQYEHALRSISQISKQMNKKLLLSDPPSVIIFDNIK